MHSSTNAVFGFHDDKVLHAAAEHFFPSSQARHAGSDDEHLGFPVGARSGGLGAGRIDEKPRWLRQKRQKERLEGRTTNQHCRDLTQTEESNNIVSGEKRERVHIS